jgi:hypothetical protein
VIPTTSDARRLLRKGELEPLVPTRLTQVDAECTAAPIIRWSGSKRQYVKTLLRFMRREPPRYVEPFCGSAAVFFSLSPATAVLSDVNSSLIAFYRTVRNKPGEVYDLFSSIPRDAQTYYESREQFSSTKIKFGQGVTVRELLDYNQFFSHDPIYTCQSFIDVFNLAIHKPDKIWALCIDEVEIMPPFLQRYLFACFRSVDQRVVLKFATSPFSAIDWDQSVPTRPMAGHDFTPINLSFSKKNEARRFSAQLLEALLISEMGLQRNSDPARLRATDVLGRSPISEANSDPKQRNAYKPPNGEHFVRFVHLREVDSGFRRFLDERNITIENIHQEQETKRAGQARKYIWSVAVRLEYGPNNIFRHKDSTTSERPPSRKTIPMIYLGYDSLMAICEGNPRITISLLRPLVRYYSGTSKSVPHEVQSELLRTAMAKCRYYQRFHLRTWVCRAHRMAQL